MTTYSTTNLPHYVKDYCGRKGLKMWRAGETWTIRGDKGEIKHTQEGLTKPQAVKILKDKVAEITGYVDRRRLKQPKEKPVILPDDPQDRPMPERFGNYTPYTRELATEILERISGGQTLNRICKDDHMPLRQTVAHWAREDVDGFAVKYARARVEQMNFYADEIIEISDDVSDDAVIDYDKNGNHYARVDGFSAARARVMIDTRKFLMAKVARAIYGEAADLTAKNMFEGADPAEAAHHLTQALKQLGVPQNLIDEVAYYVREGLGLPPLKVVDERSGNSE
jgi:hypothetical protein